MRDDALRDVVEVGGALGHVPAHAGEQVAVRGERLVHGALGGLAGGEQLRDLVDQARVLGHHRLRLEHVLGRAAGLRPAVRELGRDDRQRRPRALALALGIEVAGPIDRLRQRIGHPHDRPDRDTLSDARAPDLHHSPSRFG